MASRKRNATLEEFIEIYKSEPCLWRVKCKEYHERDKRSTAYEKLITKLKELEPTATKDDDADNSTENTIDTTDNAAANVSTGNTDDIRTPKNTPLPATRPGRKKMTEQDHLTTDILLSVKDYFKRPASASATEDRYDLVERSIAMKLKPLDKRQRLIAEKIINDTLFDAEMGNLNTGSIQNRRSLTFISLPTPSFSRTPSPSPSIVQQY
ncbi:unnamed protein product [Parnassius mnemosyne]|uniref:MADF domain-containing protein n=1 Tax=Parnassius mnemosyne TaxID=213953 RepID=A0AAV1M113_9NEOP